MYFSRKFSDYLPIHHRHAIENFQFSRSLNAVNWVINLIKIYLLASISFRVYICALSPNTINFLCHFQVGFNPICGCGIFNGIWSFTFGMHQELALHLGVVRVVVARRWIALRVCVGDRHSCVPYYVCVCVYD